MPYIIIVNRPGYLPEQDPYAVASVEDARDAACEEVEATSTARLEMQVADELEAARRLPFGGGIIGPLPDGYVIDVRRVSWHELARIAGTGSTDPQAILNAYNN